VEGRLIMKLYMKTNPFSAFKQTALGVKSLGRREESASKPNIFKRKDELHSLLKSLEKEHMIRRHNELEHSGEGA